ncbi:hypothetical protein PMI07_000820 [Rhizobium sp. CF080]|uniref:hypothetical protein n=1 Tax=Rhizobium sp. (strain CF080) TaxID=1144310 RepID=UPI000271D61A|nr:hypothetical protein [Rhizobium sp. CF080]EUB97244.1 hypothetical protein PMI07_000820 [Rhizobium sp. CF080]
MKIIAAAGRERFVVEISQEEIIKAAGFTSSYDEAWTRLNGGRDIKVGTEIKVDAAYQFHARVSSFHGDAEKSARMLRALADMMDGALPDVVIPPLEEGIFENEAFIVWSGDREKPELPDNTLVEIQTRDGRTDKARVQRLWWKHSNPDDSNFNSDIIRYRVTTKEGGL